MSPTDLSESYPKYVFHPDGRSARAESPEHEARLREEDGFTLERPAPPAPVEEGLSPEEQLAQCRAALAETVREMQTMRGQFDVSYAQAQDRIRELEMSLQGVGAERERLAGAQAEKEQLVSEKAAALAERDDALAELADLRKKARK